MKADANGERTKDGSLLACVPLPFPSINLHTTPCSQSLLLVGNSCIVKLRAKHAKMYLHMPDPMLAFGKGSEKKMESKPKKEWALINISIDLLMLIAGRKNERLLTQLALKFNHQAQSWDSIYDR